jgi:hypothetical protein
LCSLPREILDFIWEGLGRADEVVLMMACKQFANMGNLRCTKPPPADEIEYYWMLSRLASWMPSGLRLCGKCRMYRMKVTGQYYESDWCRLWLQERWKSTNNTVMEHTDRIFMCPLHRVSYETLWRLEEVRRDPQPLPMTFLGAVRLPSDGTGGLDSELYYCLDTVAYVCQRLAYIAGVIYNRAA